MSKSNSTKSPTDVQLPRVGFDSDQPFLDAISATKDDTARLAYADFLDERNRPAEACHQRLWVILRRVIAERDSDEPREEYARTCEQYGRHERAELIRLQCKRVRIPLVTLRRGSSA